MIRRTFRDWNGTRYQILLCAEAIPHDRYAVYCEREDEKKVWRKVESSPEFDTEAEAEAYLKKFAKAKDMQEVIK